MARPVASDDLGWFRRPRGADPGTLNVSYTALDRAVILGRGEALLLDEPAPVTFAALLESVAALAGALGGLGAAPGQLVLIDLPGDLDAVITRLACARVGATSVPVPPGPVAPGEDPASLARLLDAIHPDIVVSARHDAVAGALDIATSRPRACIARGPAALDRTRDVDWETALSAGATDPAGAAAVAADAAYSLTWEDRGAPVPGPTTTRERAEAVAALVARAPVPVSLLRATLEQ